MKNVSIPTPLILTGLHRSGTTWLGRIIAAASREPVIHEPLNLEQGMRDTPCWYPYHPGGKPTFTEAPYAKHMEMMLGDLLEGRARWVRKNPRAPILRKLGRAVFGTRAEREYCAAMGKGSLHRLFVKDPFCLFVSPYLIEQFDARIVIIVRHPGALIVSMRRMGWTPHIASLLLQPSLIDRYLPEYSVQQIIEQASVDDIFANALFWLAAYRFSCELAKHYPDHVFILSHEEISLGSQQALEQLLEHLGILEGLAAALSYVVATTSGKTVLPDDGILHEFSRDAVALREQWKQKLTPDEQSRLAEMLSVELGRFSGFPH